MGWTLLIGGLLLGGCTPTGTDPAAGACEARFWYVDLDGDGYGGGYGDYACEPPAGQVATSGDCDDHRADTHPGAEELCDDVDNDCAGDGEAGLADQPVWYRDGDGDGFGSAALVRCLQPEGYVADSGDCDDADPDRWPGAPERCDGIDQDCGGDGDGGAPEASLWFLDHDRDGYGDTAAAVWSCTPLQHHVALPDDCDDDERLANPGATEVCDEIDNDCDGLIDAADGSVVLSVWYRDDDGDGYGDAAVSLVQCVPPVGYVTSSDDCDDTSRAAAPDQSERCNAVDDDCDGDVDEEGAFGESGWYADGDGDGDGDPARKVYRCAAPSGYVDNAADCDDTNASITGSSEACLCRDGSDNDSDGLIDCEDSDCAASADCVELACDDGLDSDDDGRTDCRDDDCWGTETCTEPVGMAWVSGGNLRRSQREGITTGVLSTHVFSVSRQTETITATSISGSVRLFSPVASSSAWCQWQLSRADWGRTAYRSHERTSWGGTDRDSGAWVDAVSRSGFALSAGCPIAIASDEILPRYLGLRSALAGRVAYVADGSLVGCGTQWYAPAGWTITSSSVGSSTDASGSRHWTSATSTARLSSGSTFQGGCTYPP